MSRRIIGPFSRVEGHLEIELERNETTVLEARVNSPMYRGMESVMLNRAPLDALIIAPRICGICSVSQSVAAAKALAKLGNISMPVNGELSTNLILGCEVLSNHLTHFYLFFMPDFARDIYHDKKWFKDALRFKAEKGPAQGEALKARTELLHIMGVLAGKWPHTLTIRPGGTTQNIKTVEKLKLKTILRRFRTFLEDTVFGTPLEDILSLKSIQDVQHWQKNNTGDLAAFLRFSQELDLNSIGKTNSTLLSGGGFDVRGTSLFKQGIYDANGLGALPVDQISEDISHSFMAGPTSQHPFNAINDPFLDKEDAYSWCKAPRLHEESCEVGALARHVVAGHDLFVEFYQHNSSTVENRIFARVWEMALLVSHMEHWINQITPDDKFFESCAFPENGRAVAFAEAARGTLGHWIELEKGVISNYQIIAPTTWNFSPRDKAGKAGPLERALENTPILKGEDDPVNVQHIVRSFDPCMACTVH